MELDSDSKFDYILPSYSADLISSLTIFCVPDISVCMYGMHDCVQAYVCVCACSCGGQ